MFSDRALPSGQKKSGTSEDTLNDMVHSLPGGFKAMALKKLNQKVPYCHFHTQITSSPQLIDSKHPYSPRMMKDGKLLTHLAVRLDYCARAHHGLTLKQG